MRLLGLLVLLNTLCELFIHLNCTRAHHLRSPSGIVLWGSIIIVWTKQYSWNETYWWYKEKKPKVYLASPEKFFFPTFLMHLKLINIGAPLYLQLVCILDLYAVILKFGFFLVLQWQNKAHLFPRSWQTYKETAQPRAAEMATGSIFVVLIILGHVYSCSGFQPGQSV